MPDREVNTIRDLIYYQYAKIIAKRAFGLPDGILAKKRCYGFIKKRFRELRDGLMSWSDIVREDWQLVESDKECVYCGCPDRLSREHIVPRSLSIRASCNSCDTIQSIHNQIWACRDCNSSKGDRGLYEFYSLRLPEDRKFYDRIPVLLEKKYLKTIYCCHECAGTLDAGDLDGDGELTVLDIDFILHRD
ncbi:MAG: HNH endonuclease [Candidatus Thorarchaeota archaeon]